MKYARSLKHWPFAVIPLLGSMGCVPSSEVTTGVATEGTSAGTTVEMTEASTSETTDIATSDTSSGGPTTDNPTTENPAECGNGEVDESEECDGEDYCTDECKNNKCGDGYILEDEKCDDGPNNVEDYGKDPSACTTECVTVLRYCGDGTPDPEEACDDGPDNVDEEYTPGEACTTTCTVTKYCGDGELADGIEECDGEDDNISAEQCSNECFMERIVFVSQGTTNGDIDPAYCQNIVDNSNNLSGSFRPWLGYVATQTMQSPKDYFGEGLPPSFTGRVVLTDGTVVIPNWDSFIGEIQEPINLNQHGDPQGGDVWTGVHITDGQWALPTEDHNCSQWTSETDPPSGYIGDTASMTNWIYSGTKLCLTLNHVYCFQDEL